MGRPPSGLDDYREWQERADGQKASCLQLRGPARAMKWPNLVTVLDRLLEIGDLVAVIDDGQVRSGAARQHVEIGVDNPMVVDADGLNALSARAEVHSQSAGSRILTPYPGEITRLLGRRRVSSGERQPAAVVVLKGHRTFVTDGYSHTVNPGMATAGSGDVRTGLIAAQANQGLPPLDAARLGVYLHGQSDDPAADQLGQESLIATELLCFLPEAVREYGSSVSGCTVTRSVSEEVAGRRLFCLADASGYCENNDSRTQKRKSREYRRR